jgi:hypothetical protein
LWLDDLPDRLEAQNQSEEESKIGDSQESSAKGKEKDLVYEMKRRLGEQFTAAVRLYAEAVSVFTSSSLAVSRDECNRLRKIAEEAQGRAEAIGIAFEEHLELHRSQMPVGVRPEQRFNLEPQKLPSARAALFRQIEIADKLARELAMPELRALLADMAEEAHHVFQPSH